MVSRMTSLMATRWILYLVSISISLWGGIIFQYIVVLLLFVALSTFVFSIPLQLNWSKNMYPMLLRALVFFILVTIVSFSIIYYRSGVIDGLNASKISKSYIDSLYLSMSMFSSLGYGSILPTSNYKILTALESLLGYFTMGLCASFLWLFTTERKSECSLDEINFQSQSGLVISPSFKDRHGEFIAVEEEQQQKTRAAEFHINSCESCKGNDILIERYYNVMGYFVPIAKYVVVCKGCKKDSSAKLSARQAVHDWNKKNPKK